MPTASGVGSRFEASANCDFVLNRIRRTVTDAGVADAQDRPIPGMNFLRVNRLLARMGQRFKRGRADRPFEAWVDRLQKLEIEGLQVEVANLPTTTRKRLARAVAAPGAAPSDIVKKAKRCGHLLRRRYLSTAAARQRLVRAARVPDNYSDTAQILGAYPLTSIPVNQGWQRWKAKNLPSFNRRLADQPSLGRLVEYYPTSSAAVLRRQEVRSLLNKSQQSLLGIPEPSGVDLKRLLNTFAPIWRIDTVEDYDRPGVPTWRRWAASPHVDVRRPVTFGRISHAILDNKVHLQLNYSIWFRKRPSSGPLDLLSGNLDGVVWRVTLGNDGRPLIYDSIHLCGCYHFLFPVGSRFKKERAERNPNLKEVPAIISGLLAPRHGQRMTLRLASGSHYLLSAAVTNTQSANIPRHKYALENETVLRTLPFNGTQRRSLYRSDGLIAGTQRLERLILWPTGVVSPGAMRQWGHHAIAFSDRRHFDDPDLFDTIFDR
ncbi:MAG: hypothetical protein JXQ99_17565 [Hyphomicrobiaceae bacterium]